MADFFQWCWDNILWLKGLASPDSLREMVKSYHEQWWICYAILSAIIFSETGLLIGFFLPGDSLLFAVGFLASQGLFDIVLLNICLSAAAILGDAVNYSVGLRMGEAVFEKGRLRFVKHSHLLAAKSFYERHGGMAIVLARFVPLVRTFTPFVAGIARMSYRRFVLYNIGGGIGWVAVTTLAGYFLGKIPWVEKNFEAVMVGIVVVSVLPVAGGILRGILRRGPSAKEPPTKERSANEPPEAA